MERKRERDRKRKSGTEGAKGYESKRKDEKAEKGMRRNGTRRKYARVPTLRCSGR